MIEIENLTKRFGPTLAVDGLTLSVGQGEVLGLLGPNGAGKTTTVRMLSCLLAPTAGRISISGLLVGRDDARIRRIVGILTESPGLYERLSAQQNLDYFARLYGLDEERREAQVEAHLRMLGLWERRREAVAGFSKGMKQKIAIARALVHEPKLLLLDEPTSALDPESAHTVREFIEELKTQGRTVILCTHNLDEADRLCDRIAIVKQRLIRVDTPTRLRSDLYGRRVELHPAFSNMDPADVGQIMIVSQFMFFLLLIPVIVPMTIATFSIIGEKQARSLEPLLATPIRTWELLLGKSVAAALPAVAMTWLCYGILLVGMAILASPVVFASVASGMWLLAIIVIVPLLAILAVNLGVLVSSRVNDTRVAQQIGGLVVLPLVGLGIAQTMGRVLFSLPMFAVGAVAMVALDVAVLVVAVKLFQRETMLTRWK